MRKKSSRPGTNKQGSMIFARLSEDHRYACGYIRWYEQHAKQLSVNMFAPRYSAGILLEIQAEIEKEKFHFSARIKKTHPTSIPELVLLMRTKQFLREIADRVLSSHNGVQLEFQFEPTTNKEIRK